MIFKQPARKPETLRKHKVNSKKSVSIDILEDGGGDIVGDVPIDLLVPVLLVVPVPIVQCQSRFILPYLRKISMSLKC